MRACIAHDALDHRPHERCRGVTGERVPSWRGVLTFFYHVCLSSLSYAPPYTIARLTRSAAGPMRERIVASIEGSRMFITAIMCFCCGARCPISTGRIRRGGSSPTTGPALVPRHLPTHRPRFMRTHPSTIRKSVLRSEQMSLNNPSKKATFPYRDPLRLHGIRVPPKASSTTQRRRLLYRPSVGPPLQKHKNQGTNPIWRGVCASGCWHRSRAASTSSSRARAARSSPGWRCAGDHSLALMLRSPLTHQP